MYEFSSSIQTCGCQNVGSNLCDFYSQRPYASSLPLSGQIVEMEGRYYIYIYIAENKSWKKGVGINHQILYFSIHIRAGGKLVRKNCLHRNKIHRQHWN